VIGLGIDAVDIERFRKVLARSPGLAARVFTADERVLGSRSADPVPRLAARFAAKEATMKALGVGLGAIGFHDVEVRTAASGAPSLAVTGRAAALAAALGIVDFKVSLTHTDNVAEAVVAAL